jgi:hypothetical protein
MVSLREVIFVLRNRAYLLPIVLHLLRRSALLFSTRERGERSVSTSFVVAPE